MKVHLVDNGTRYVRSLEALLGNDVTVVPWKELGTLSADVSGLVVLSGGHGAAVVYDHGVYVKEIEFIRSRTLPLLGVCLGFELIAHAFGGSLTLLRSRTHGMVDINPVSDDQIFQGKKHLTVYENHRWVVTHLGPDLLGIARSRDGFEVIRHKTRPCYAFQFHPELFADISDGGSIFRNALRIFDQ